MTLRKYIPFDPTKEWPAGKDLYYECLICGLKVSSIKNNECLCHNLYVDASAGRMGADDPTKVRLFNRVHMDIIIPKEEQLETVSKGPAEFNHLLQHYLGDINNSGDLLVYFTVTKSELISYLRASPELMNKHLYKEGTPRFHEELILEFDGKKYRVYEMDHDTPRNIKEYDDFAEATADFLISYLPR